MELKLIQDEIIIYYSNITAKVVYTIDNNKTIADVTTDLAKVLSISEFKTRLTIAGECCGSAELVQDYKNKYPDKNFYVILMCHTPRDNVYNFRCMQKLLHQYVLVEKCVNCLTNTPNVAGGDCKHDSILCADCAIKLEKCPACEAGLRSREKCYL